MNKKVLVILATCAMAISSVGFMAGCSKKNTLPTVATPLVTEQETQPAIKLLAQTEAEPQVESAVMQNPVMNFTGNYFNNRTTLLVEADGSENVKLTIVLSEDSKTKTVLNADAKFNPLTSSIAYCNGTKKEIALDKDGAAVSEKELYTNGTGVIVFVNSEATWNDENEKIENMTFRFGVPEEIKSGYEVTTQNTKTVKSAKKTAKTTKKAAKKAVKKTTGSKNSVHGKSIYAAKNLRFIVNINKNNKANVVIEHTPLDTDMNFKYNISEGWYLSGKYDPKTGIISYSNCNRMHYVKSLTYDQSRCFYLNGKGEIKISGNTLTWNDRTEHYADGIHFSKV